jgi:hypothetical protein
MRSRFREQAPPWLKHPPRHRPPTPLWGLGAAWSGRRECFGTWDAKDRWVSYDLAHFRGQYWNPEKPRLVVSHRFKTEPASAPGSGGARRFGAIYPSSLEDAAVTAVVQYVSDNNALDLDGDALRRWTRATIEAQVKQQTLDSDWLAHNLVLDGDAVPAQVKWMPNGFCLVAETATCFLAISARHISGLVRLVRQDNELRRYKARPEQAR